MKPFPVGTRIAVPLAPKYGRRKMLCTYMGELGYYVTDLYDRPYEVRRSTVADMQKVWRRLPNFPEGRPLTKVETVRDRAVVMGGLGDYTTETVKPFFVKRPFSRVIQRPSELNGLGANYIQAVTRPQEWYSRIANLQKGITVAISSISAIPALTWNVVFADVKQGKVQGPSDFLYRHQVLEKLMDAANSVFVTSTGLSAGSSNTAFLLAALSPLVAGWDVAKMFAFENRLDAAQRTLSSANAMLAVVKRLNPEANQAASEAAAGTNARLSQYALESPNSAAVKKFKEKVEQSFFDFGKYVVPIGIAVVALLWLRK